MLDMNSKAWVTDFGLARMETDANLTMTGDLLGTLRYMSPEQTMAKRIVVDRRTDIYSLGVTLYELLTLKPAFPNDDRHELMRKIAFDDPPAPRKLNRFIPAELETIILKAISKNPDERYETAQELADDLCRFLEHKPILAKRTTIGQRLAKWSRRHRNLVWSVASVLLLATIGLSISNVLISLERDAKSLALQERDKALAEKQIALEESQHNEKKAISEATKAKAVSNLIKNMFNSGIPYTIKGSDYTISQLFDDFSENLGDQLQNQPEVEATFRTIIGTAYMSVGVPDKAEPHLRAALELRRHVYGEEHEKVVESLFMCALNASVRGDSTEMAALLRSALAIARKQDDQQAVLRALIELQTALNHTENSLEAETLGYQALAIAGKLGLEQDIRTSLILGRLAVSRLKQGDSASAVRLAREALAISLKVHGEDHNDVATAYSTLGWTLECNGDYAEAEANWQKCLSILRKHANQRSWFVANTLRNIGSVALAQGDEQRAEDHWRKSLEITANLLARQPSFARPQKVLGWSAGRLFDLYVKQRRWDKAVAEFSKVVQIAPNADSGIWRRLGRAHYRTGNWKEAVIALQVSTERETRGDTSNWLFLAMANWQLSRQQDLPADHRSRCKREARRWYEKYAAWMQHNPEDQILHGIRAEAEQLMGITEQESEARDQKPEVRDQRSEKKAEGSQQNSELLRIPKP